MKKKPNTKLYEWQMKCADPSSECAKCHTKRLLGVDHIVPVNILEQFGLDRYEISYNLDMNFQILCRYCNLEKAGSLDPRNPVTYQVLEYVIKRSKKDALGLVA
jgi:hypothetical protein